MLPTGPAQPVARHPAAITSTVLRRFMCAPRRGSWPSRRPARRPASARDLCRNAPVAPADATTASTVSIGRRRAIPMGDPYRADRSLRPGRAPARAPAVRPPTRLALPFVRRRRVTARVRATRARAARDDPAPRAFGVTRAASQTPGPVAPAPSRTRGRSSLEVVLLQLVSQRIVGEAEASGGLGAVAAGRGERVFEEADLEGRDGL